MNSIYQLRRPIDESDFGANDGIGVATDAVRLWLEGEPRLLEEARREIAKGVPLSAFVADILYPGGGVIANLRPDEKATAETVRAEIEAADGGFDGIDWLFVRYDIAD